MADSDDELSWWSILERTVVGGDNQKRLYLVFGEYKRCGEVLFSIHATDLRQDISEIAYKHEKGLPVHKACGVYGSKIIFVGGVESIYDGIEQWDFAPHPTKDVYVFETDPELDPTPNIISRPNFELFNYSSLRGGKSDPIIKEHDGKLFVLSTYPLRFAGVPMVPAFEVFNPKEGDWKSLPYPPPFELLYQERGLCTLFNYLILGSNIFVSSGLCTGPLNTSVFRFNLAEPAKGWQPHTFVDCDRLPLDFSSRSMAVECMSGDWVILNYDPSYPNLPVHLMSKDLKSLKPLAPLRLPFGFSPSDYHGNRILAFHNFFHIEGQKVGLVVAVDGSGKKNRLMVDKCWPEEFPIGYESDSEIHNLDGVGLVESENWVDNDVDWDGETFHRPISIYVVPFEFELDSGKNAIAFIDLDPLHTFSYDAGDRPIKSGNTEVEMLQALWL